MAKSSILALFFIVLSMAPCLILCDEAHDQLESYGLPAGLLPDAVKSYTSNDDGTFEVKLSCSKCYVHFPSDLVYCDSTIRGKISHGRITDLSGIQAKKLFLWVAITEIVAHPDTGNVEFKAGFISESRPQSDFQSIRGCRNSLRNSLSASISSF